jgi:hypothetical protein
MAKPRVTATDRLSNVVDVVELGRRTGLLSVERTLGAMLEEAEIYFVSGNPIYATLGPLRGHDALNALAQWNDCRFCFDPHAPQPIPNVSGVLPAIDRSSPSGFGYAYDPGASASGVHPGFSGANASGSHPFFGQPSPASPGSWNSPASGYPSGSLGGNPGGNPGGNLGGNSGGNSGASGANWGTGNAGFGSPASSSGGSGGSGATWGAGSGPLAPNTPSSFGSGANPTTPDPNAQARLRRRPRRAPDVRDLITVVTTYNLSRAHRTVLLLADGEHSVLDLARLSGKPVEEVSTLLGELEGRGLVYYYQ